MMASEKIRRLRDIEVLILDNCTRREAVAHLNNGSVVYEAEDLEKFIEDFLDGWGYNYDEESKEDKKLFYDMIKTGKSTMEGWNVVNHGKKRYYISYCL